MPSIWLDNSTNAAPVAGIDGCRGGWLVALANPGADSIQWSLAHSIQQAADHCRECQFVAVDMPIGLLDHATPGGRFCDQEARRLLPAGWKSSVFTPPVRAAVYASDYETGLLLNRRSSDEAVGFSLQAWNIVPKIRELDEFLTPSRQLVWQETFPELAFLAMNGGAALRHRKKTKEGQLERRRLIRKELKVRPSDPTTLLPRSVAQPDDYWDALACLVVARKLATGRAQRVGDGSLHDSRGLVMQMCY